MKYVIIFTILLASTMSQRPSYAGNRAVGYPGLASRFRNNENTVNTGNVASNTPDLGTRLGAFNPGQSFGNDGFVDYTKMYESWPRENLPYWYVNSEEIRKHLGVNTRNNQVNTNGQREPVLNRFGSDSNTNSFTTSVSGQSKTYYYDPSSDTWFSRNV